MSLATEIITARLILRPLEKYDAADVFAYAKDRDVARHTSWSAHRSIDDAHAFIDHVLKYRNITPGNFQLTWAMRLTTDGAVIGTISLVQDSVDTAHTDYVLAKPYWGRGLTTEALNGIAEWAFYHLPNLAILRSGCLSQNRASCRVLQKCGFTLSGVERITFGKKFDHQTLEVSNFERRKSRSAGS